MKRPVCVCCGILLAALLAMDLLPQAAFWVPAAFLMCLGLVLIGKKQNRDMGRCICIGALLATLLFLHTLCFVRLPAERMDGTQPAVSAVVKECHPSYAEGQVSAVLHITAANGSPADFLCVCSCMPECAAGDVITGDFQFEPVESGKRCLSNYADGIFVQAGYAGNFRAAGQEQSLAVWMHRAQAAMSNNIRRYLSADVGGTLAAMTVGDRNYIPDQLKTAYQNSGIPHILVVSGLHLSLLCGLIPLRRRKDNRLVRIFCACAGIAVSLLMIGITGASPSIVRAGCAVILCGIGELLGYPADPLTSLALAGAGMSAFNAYAVCDIAFELSFMATAGVLLAGSELRRLDRKQEKSAEKIRLPHTLRDTVVISAAAAAFTLPVQVLRGLNLSAVSIFTNLATVWLLPPLLILGFLVAILGFFPPLLPVMRLCALAGGILAQFLNQIVRFMSNVPGAHLCAETGYPAAAAFWVGGFLMAAAWRKIPKRKAFPAAMLLICMAFMLQAGLSHDLVKIALIGNARVPSVVITQNGEAEVLFRGGNYNVQKIKEYLEEENIDSIRTLVDFRMDAERACALDAEKEYLVSEIADGDRLIVDCGPVQLNLFRMGSGCYAWFHCGRRSILTVTGTPTDTGNIYRTDLLLATGSAPAQAKPDHILSLTDSFAWLDSCPAESVYYGESGAAVWLRPGPDYSRWNQKLTGVNGWLC